MGQNRGRNGAILTPITNSFFLFGGTYVCANFGENRSRNATVRVLADGQIHRLTDANRFYNLSLVICYSYGTDKNPIYLLFVFPFECQNQPAVNTDLSHAKHYLDILYRTEICAILAYFFV